jgi:hypothetical protein
LLDHSGGCKLFVPFPFTLEKAAMFPKPHNVKPAKVMAGSVYFVHSPRLEMVKIGRTTDKVEKRVATMQTGSADRLSILSTIETDDCAQLEGLMHNMFWDRRSHGEWFEGDPDLLEFAKAEEPFDGRPRFGLNFHPTPMPKPVFSIEREAGETADGFYDRCRRELDAAGFLCGDDDDDDGDAH